MVLRSLPHTGWQGSDAAEGRRGLCSALGACGPRQTLLGGTGRAPLHGEPARREQCLAGVGPDPGAPPPARGLSCVPPLLNKMPTVPTVLRRAEESLLPARTILVPGHRLVLSQEPHSL